MSNAIARKIASIEKKGGMHSADVANILGARPETVSRWHQGKAFPPGKIERRLLELDYIVDLLSDFYEPPEVRIWLYSRQRVLDGETPASLIEQGKTEKILEALEQLRDGIYI